MLQCPRCLSVEVVKNGHTRSSGKQNHLCNYCGRNFVINPDNQIDDRTKELISKALLERASLRGLCRIFSVSMTWLLTFITKTYRSLPRDLNLKLPEIVHLTAGVFVMRVCEADELWSFVGSKDNPQWVWLVIDRESRQVIAFHVGGRTKGDARALWEKIPQVYKDCGFYYTDFLASYKQAWPKGQHVGVGKETGETCHIERLNNTFRQRISRLVRKALSFSKSLVNHVGAIMHFICHYNAELAVGI